MRTFLLFRLYSPLASWGAEAPGTYRPSWDRPSRSALLGLVGAALGVRRNEAERLAELAAKLRFGVLTEAPGTAITDYHTIHTAARPGRTRAEELIRRAESRDASSRMEVSTREYRTDALHTVAAWCADPADEAFLDHIAEALRRPVFVLYLGRKACLPGLPPAPTLVRGETLKDAFDAADGALPPLPDAIASLIPDARRDICWEGPSDEGYADPGSRWRRDDPVSRDSARWSFAEREERFAHTTSRFEGDRDVA